MTTRTPRSRTALFALALAALTKLAVAVPPTPPPLPDPREEGRTHLMMGAFGSVLLEQARGNPVGVLGSVLPAVGRSERAAGDLRLLRAGFVTTLDRFAPSSSVTSPLQCDNPTDVADIRIAAEASDARGDELGSGVKVAQVRVEDNRTSESWNGSGWVDVGDDGWADAWLTLSPGATPGTHELSAAVVSAIPWERGRAYEVTSRAIDVAGNVEAPPVGSSVLFQFDGTKPVTQVDSPVHAALHGEARPVDSIEGRACEDASAPIEDVMVRLRVTTTTAASPDDDTRFGQYWDGTDWTDEEQWLASDLDLPDWVLDTTAADFDCDPDPMEICGHGITVTSVPTTGPGEPDEDDGASIVFFFDAEAPLAGQDFPPHRSKQRRVARITGGAKDCGDAAPGSPPPTVELLIVRQVEVAPGEFEDGSVYWSQDSGAWLGSPEWLEVIVEEDPALVPFERCPLEGWSYDWEYRLPVDWESGYRYRIRVRTTDAAGNVSHNLGDTFHFDDTLPNPPSADRDRPALVVNAEVPGSPATPVGHDTWQNTTPNPVFRWDEPWDDCDPSLTGCFLADPDRESSEIRRYHATYSEDPAAPLVERQDAGDRDFESPVLAPEGVFAFRVKAEDRAGNESTVKDFVVKHEVTPPLVTAITAPPDASRLYITSVPQVTGRVVDPGTVVSGVERVEVRIREVPLAGGPARHLSWDRSDPFDDPEWVSGEAWIVADLVGGPAVADWILPFPDDPFPWSFDHEYTVHVRAHDVATNVTPEAEWPSVSYEIRRPRLVTLGLATRPRQVGWDEQFSITWSLESPLTEPITVPLEVREVVARAMKVGGASFPDDPDVYREYDVREIVGSQDVDLAPGERKKVTYRFVQSWRWLAPVEGDFAECAGTGLLMMVPGPAADKLVKLKKLARVKGAIDAGSNYATMYSIMGTLGGAIEAVVTAMPQVEFSHELTSEISVEDIDRAPRPVNVHVPTVKIIELVASLALNAAAEVTSLVADFDPEPISKAVLLGTEAAEAVAACGLAESAADPDPDFEVIVEPRYVSVDDVTDDPTVLGEPAARLYVQTWLDTLASQEAMFAARNKGWGALEAGDRTWIVRQSEATRFFASLTRDGYRSLAEQSARMLDELDADALEVSDAGIAAAKESFATDGLPELERDFLAFHGFPESTMDLLAEHVAAAPSDPVDVAERNDVLRAELSDLPETLGDMAAVTRPDAWLFVDDFDDAIFDGWDLVGPWDFAPTQVAEGGLEQAASGGVAPGRALLLSDESFSGAHRIQVDASPSAEPFSLLWHVQDESNHGELLVSPGDPATVEVLVVEGGVRRTILGPIEDTLPNRDWHRLRVDVGDGRVAVHVDDLPGADVPEVREPWLWGEVEDDTFDSGGVGLAVEGGDAFPTLFDDIRVTTLFDGRRSGAPELSVTPDPAAPLDTERVTFEVAAPDGATPVVLFVGGREVARWDDPVPGERLTWESEPFGEGCTVPYAATARMPDGSFLSSRVDSNEVLAVSDTTPPAVEPILPRIELEAQECDGVTGWVDRVPWLNVQVFDACDEEPDRVPPAGETVRYALGTTTVDLSATDDSSNVGTASYDVFVFNTPPDLPAPAAGVTPEGAALTLSATATDPRTQSLTFRWDWGDGSAVDVARHDALDDTAAVTVTDVAEHVYGDDGTYTVTVSVEDDCGTVTTSTTTVEVSNVPPTIAPIGPFLADEADVVSLAARASDPGSDDLTFEWNFGHPAVGTAESTHFNDGSGPDPPRSGPGVFPFEPLDEQLVAWGDDGTYPVELVVRDDDGGTASFSTTASVANLPPMIDEDSVEAFAAADVTLRVVGPAGVEDRDHSGPGAPVPVYVPGFEAQVLLFVDDELVASGSLVEDAATGTAELTLPDLELRVDAPGTARIVYSTRIDRAATAILELRFEDGTSRTAGVLLPRPLDAPGHVVHPVPFDEPVVRTWRTSLGGMLPGTTGAGSLELRAVVRGLDGQLEEGLLGLALTESGALLDEASLDVEEVLRDARREDFPDEDGDRKPDDFVLTLDPFVLDPDATYEGLFQHADGDETLSSGLARVGPVGLDAGLNLAWPELESAVRCDRPEREPDCLFFDWSEDLGSLLFGAPLSVRARGTDAGSDDLEFTWDWGDGSAATVGLHFNDGLGPDPLPSPEVAPIDVVDEQSHRFVGLGDFPLMLSLRDDDGGLDVHDVSVVILGGNLAPEIDEGSLALSEVLEDPHDRGHSKHQRNYLVVEVDLADADSDVLSVTVDWGDGSVEQVELRYSGDPENAAPFAPRLSTRHDYDAGGTYDVALTVADDAGGVDAFVFSATTLGND